MTFPNCRPSAQPLSAFAHTPLPVLSGPGIGRFVRLGRFMSASLAVLLPLVCVLSTQLASGQEVLDGVAAVVNDQPVTFSQVRELVGAKERAISEQFQGAELGEKIKKIRTEAIEELINRQLILQYFKEKGFQLPPYLIEDRIATIIREEHNGDRAAFARKLAAFGLTIERFRKDEMDKIIVQSMRQQAVKSTPVVPLEKLKSFYKEHLPEFTTEEQIQLRMIILRSNDKGSPEQRQRFLEEIRQRVAGGAKFADLAKLYSEDNTAESGGDWGWVQAGTLNETLSKAATGLKPGQTSKPVFIGNTAYLLFCEAKKPRVVQGFEESRDIVEKVMLGQERQKAQDEWIAKLRKKAYVKIF